VGQGFGADVVEGSSMIRVWEVGAPSPASVPASRTSPASAMKRRGSPRGGGSSHSQRVAQDGLDALDVRLVPAQFSQESYEIYKAYQIKVHGDPPDHLSPSSYRRFLVDSPLVAREADAASPGDPPLGYGSFHIEYRLPATGKGKDEGGLGRLIAVGVVDVLPLCLSSVYLYYDPEYAKLSPGKLSALWEIRWVAERARLGCALRYYYLGFYIHSCPKMRYKGQYHPSELLCPETKEWFPLEACTPLLDATPYVAFGKHLTGGRPRTCPPSPQPAEDDESGKVDGVSEPPRPRVPFRGIFSMPVMLNKNVITFGNLMRYMPVSPPSETDGVLEEMREYLALVGETLARNIVYIIR